VAWVKVVKPGHHPPCPVPLISRLNARAEPDFDVGTQWRCDDCGRLYELLKIPARGMKGTWELIEEPEGEG